MATIYKNMKVSESTHQAFRMIAAMTGEEIRDVAARLSQRELLKLQVHRETHSFPRDVLTRKARKPVRK